MLDALFIFDLMYVVPVRADEYVELALLGYESFSLMVDTLELSLESGMEKANLFNGCELLRLRLLDRGDRGVGGDMPLIPLLAHRLELLLAEVFTVLTLVSERASSFLTASVSASL